jgi:hypothetical protein
MQRCDCFLNIMYLHTHKCSALKRITSVMCFEATARTITFELNAGTRDRIPFSAWGAYPHTIDDLSCCPQNSLFKIF